MHSRAKCVIVFRVLPGNGAGFAQTWLPHIAGEWRRLGLRTGSLSDALTCAWPDTWRLICTSLADSTAVWIVAGGRRLVMSRSLPAVDWLGGQLASYGFEPKVPGRVLFVRPCGWPCASCASLILLFFPSGPGAPNSAPSFQ